MIQRGNIRKKFSKSTGNLLGYTVELYHDGLQEYRHLQASEPYVLEGKISQQEGTWHDKWNRRLQKEQEAKEADERRRIREADTAEKEAKAKSAMEPTKQKGELGKLRKFLNTL